MYVQRAPNEDISMAAMFARSSGFQGTQRGIKNTVLCCCSWICGSMSCSSEPLSGYMQDALERRRVQIDLPKCG